MSHIYPGRSEKEDDERIYVFDVIITLENGDSLRIREVPGDSVYWYRVSAWCGKSTGMWCQGSEVEQYVYTIDDPEDKVIMTRLRPLDTPSQRPLSTTYRRGSSE